MEIFHIFEKMFSKLSAAELLQSCCMWERVNIRFWNIQVKVGAFLNLSRRLGKHLNISAKVWKLLLMKVLLLNKSEKIVAKGEIACLNNYFFVHTVFKSRLLQRHPGA